MLRLVTLTLTKSVKFSLYVNGERLALLNSSQELCTCSSGILRSSVSFYHIGTFLPISSPIFKILCLINWRSYKDPHDLSPPTHIFSFECHECNTYSVMQKTVPKKSLRDIVMLLTWPDSSGSKSMGSNWILLVKLGYGSCLFVRTCLRTPVVLERLMLWGSGHRRLVQYCKLCCTYLAKLHFCFEFLVLDSTKAIERHVWRFHGAVPGSSSCWWCPRAGYRSQSVLLCAPPYVQSQVKVAAMGSCYNSLLTATNMYWVHSLFLDIFVCHSPWITQGSCTLCLPPMVIDCFACSQDEKFLIYFAYILNHKLLY